MQCIKSQKQSIANAVHQTTKTDMLSLSSRSLPAHPQGLGLESTAYVGLLRQLSEIGAHSHIEIPSIGAWHGSRSSSILYLHGHQQRQQTCLSRPNILLPPSCKTADRDRQLKRPSMWALLQLSVETNQPENQV
eukprot:1142125-Pelagomonas_calceolata.AAC.1